MSSGLDLSLDDLIKQSKSRAKPSPSSSSRPARRATSASRTTPYPPVAPKAFAPEDSPYGVYSEHVAAMAAPPPPPPQRALHTGTKLHISNLNASITVEDVQELFSEVGDLKFYSVNYDNNGKSKGTAEVVFARKKDALDAIERYNGVLLDGKPMKIELIGNYAEPPALAPLMYNRPFPNYNATPARDGLRGQFHGNGRPGGNGQDSGRERRTFQGRGRPASSGQGGVGRVQGSSRGHDRNRVRTSAADLDAELEQYHAAAVKQE